MKNKQSRIIDRAGFSLVEVIVVIALIGILVAIAIQPVNSRLRVLNINDCAQKLASDIRLTRASAMNKGLRGQLVITDDGTMKNFGNGQNALWMSYLNTIKPNTPVTASFANGDTVLSSSSCAGDITIETAPAATLLPICPAGTIGATNRCMWFTTTGALHDNNGDTIGKNIRITSRSDNSYKVRINIISLTGYARVQSCTAGGAVDCSNENDWHDIQ